MHRPTLALIAIVLLVLGALTDWHGDDGVSSACFRVGAVVCILWFAHPQLRALPRWLIAGACIALLVATRWPKVLLLALPIAAVLWMLGPRGKPRRVKDEG